MKYLLLKSKKALAIISGMLFTGFILNTLSNKATFELVQANQGGEITAVLPAVSELALETDINISETIEEQTPKYIPNPDQVGRIRAYLTGRRSPLAQYAEEFVTAADHYGIDYRLVASISIIESSGGLYNFRPHNAWGWGKVSFGNWEEGIWTVTKGLSIYYSKGLTTPKLISRYYCPPSAESWAMKVQFVMNEIAK